MLLSDMKNSQRNFLLYSELGVGKTCLAASFPGPVRYFDFDCKISSAKNFYEGNNELLSGIEVSQYPVVSAPGKLRPFMQFVKDLNEFDTSQRKEQKFKTLIIDTFTTLQYLVTIEEMVQRPGKADRDSMLGVEAPNLKDFGMANSYLTHLTGKILSIPCDNIVFLGHIKMYEDKKSGVITRSFATTPALVHEIPKRFQEVYRLYTKIEGGKLKRFMQTQPDRYVARSQIKNLPATVEYTDLGYKALEKFL